MNKLKIVALSFIAFLAIGITGCKKEYDHPPVTEIPVGSIISLTDLRNMYTGSAVEFTDDINVFCVVTADEVSGNLYKNVYVSDGPAAMNVRLVASGGLYEGDSIRINLNGTILDEYNGMLQLDLVDVDVNVVKQATNVNVTPITVTIDDVIANPNLQAQLVRIENVEFLNGDVGTTYADAVGQLSANKTLMDCNGTQVLVRTSGYAQFAGETVPAGNGSVVAIIGQYNNDKQLYLRRTSDVSLPNASCQPTVFLDKNFDDGSITSGGWINFWIGTTTTENWGEWSIFGGDVAAASNFDVGTFTNYACESWMISPAMNLSAATNPFLTFDNVVRYNGPALELYVSTDYPGSGDPNSVGTWTNITSTVPVWDFDSGDWNFVSSGSVDLSAYLGANTYIAFKYTGTSVDGSTWELDNIRVEE